MFTSNHLAFASALFAILAAVAAGFGTVVAGRETDAAVDKAKAESKVEVEKAKAQAASAQAEAARANERAATLENDAAQAKLELARIKEGVSARTLSKLQRERIVRALKGKTQASFVMTYAGGAESDFFSLQIGQALEAAGMKVWREPYPIGALPRYSGPGNPMIMYVPIPVDATGSNIKDPVYQALSKALGPISLSANIMDRGVMTRPAYYMIQVGDRSAPTLK